MRQFTLKTLQAAVAVALLAGASLGQAQVAVDVDIDVGEIAILYTFTDLDVVIDSSALATLLGGSAACSPGTAGRGCGIGSGGPPVSVNSLGGNLVADFFVLNELGNVAPLNTVDLVLTDVWAVRAIGGTSGNTTVSVTVPGGTTLTNGTSSIGITGAAVAPASFADPGLGSVQPGSVTLTLDLSNVTQAGNHDSGQDTGDTVYTIDITAT